MRTSFDRLANLERWHLLHDGAISLGADPALAVQLADGGSLASRILKFQRPVRARDINACLLCRRLIREAGKQATVRTGRPQALCTPGIWRHHRDHL